jgi:hypothetical protein
VFKLLEIPGSTDYEFASYKLFTNNVHGKLSLDGMALARKTDGQFDFQQTTPVLKQLLYTLPKGNDPMQKESEDILRTDNFANATDILNYYGVKYITVSKKYTDDKIQKNIDAFVKQYISLTDTYSDKYLTAYEVQSKQPEGFYAKLDTNNGQFSLATSPKGVEYFTRKLGSGAEMEVVNMGKVPININMGITAKSAEGYVLGVSLPDGNTKGIMLSGDFAESTFQFIAGPGINKIKFLLTENATGKEVELTEKGKGGAEVKDISMTQVDKNFK